MSRVEKYHREPESTGELLDRVEKLEDDEEIGSSLASSLMIAIYQQCQVDYDAIQAVFNAEDTSEEVRQLLIDTGVIIVLTEEQTRSVKYGV